MASNQCLVRSSGPLQIAAASVTQATVSLTTVDKELLAPGTYRWILIQNRGTTEAYLSLDGGAAVVADGFELLPGGTHRQEATVLGAGIRGIRSSGTGNVIVATGV